MMMIVQHMHEIMRCNHPPHLFNPDATIIATMMQEPCCGQLTTLVDGQLMLPLIKLHLKKQVELLSLSRLGNGIQTVHDGIYQVLPRVKVCNKAVAVLTTMGDRPDLVHRRQHLLHSVDTCSTVPSQCAGGEGDCSVSASITAAQHLLALLVQGQTMARGVVLL
jgi:hypothetical protein